MEDESEYVFLRKKSCGSGHGKKNKMKMINIDN